MGCGLKRELLKDSEFLEGGSPGAGGTVASRSSRSPIPTSGCGSPLCWGCSGCGYNEVRRTQAGVKWIRTRQKIHRSGPYTGAAVEGGGRWGASERAGREIPPGGGPGAMARVRTLLPPRKPLLKPEGTQGCQGPSEACYRGSGPGTCKGKDAHPGAPQLVASTSCMGQPARGRAEGLSAKGLCT